MISENYSHCLKLNDNCNKMIKIFNISTSISECWYQMFDYHITWVCVDRQGKDRMVTK